MLTNIHANQCTLKMFKSHLFIGSMDVVERFFILLFTIEYLSFCSHEGTRGIGIMSKVLVQ